jgi:hypothetical protein
MPLEYDNCSLWLGDCCVGGYVFFFFHTAFLFSCLLDGVLERL